MIGTYLENHSVAAAIQVLFSGNSFHSANSEVKELFFKLRDEFMVLQ